MGDVVRPVPAAGFVEVTPKLAKEWLAKNFGNRPIREQDLDRYRRDMLAGRWHNDGSPLRFTADGELLDGQHRLRAVIAANRAVVMLVVRGVDREAQIVMDTGRRRTAADALAIAGRANPVMAAAVAKLFLEAEAGKFAASGKHEVSHEEIFSCLETNPDIATAIDFTMPLARRCDCPPAIVAYAYLRQRRISSKDAAEFWCAMAEKVGLHEGDPVIALSNRLAEARRARERLSRAALMSLIFRAWNARRKGKPVRILRVGSSKGGLVPILEPI